MSTEKDALRELRTLIEKSEKYELLLKKHENLQNKNKQLEQTLEDFLIQQGVNKHINLLTNNNVALQSEIERIKATYAKSIYEIDSLNKKLSLALQKLEIAERKVSDYDDKLSDVTAKLKVAEQKISLFEVDKYNEIVSKICEKFFIKHDKKNVLEMLNAIWHHVKMK